MSDTQCAPVYLNQSKDVAFLPFRRDPSNKPVEVSRAVRTRLESEQRALDTNALAAIIPLTRAVTAGRRKSEEAN